MVDIVVFYVEFFKVYLKILSFFIGDKGYYFYFY